MDIIPSELMVNKDVVSIGIVVTTFMCRVGDELFLDDELR